MSALKLGTATASLTNHLLSGTRGQPVPVVGMGATKLGWTDRHPATIVAVGPNARWVDVKADNAERVDDNGMSESQEWVFSPNPDAPAVRYSLRKNGAYVRVGDSMDGARLRIGDRDRYHDFSF